MCIRNVKGRPLEHRSLRVILVISCLALLSGASGASETVCERGWSAGIAKTDITPTIPMWLAGYGSRDRPSDGTVHPINREADVPLIRAQGKHLKGRVDHSVPVLAVRNMDHSLLAVVFGYACHNTTLSSYQWSGDYAGFAQLTIEKHHPEAQAMFVLGCGGDQNPLPRRTIALAEQYGRELSAAVMEVLKKPMQTQKPRIRTAFQFVQLDFESTITKQTLLADRDSPRVIKSRWARRMLRQLVSGVPFKTSYPYATQVWMLGDQLWIALGGEALVGYSHRFKAEYGKSTWVTGYFADLTAYIPTRSDWEEGGYEVDFLYEYMLPAERWAGDLETRIADAIEDQVQNVSKE